MYFVYARGCSEMSPSLTVVAKVGGVAQRIGELNAEADMGRMLLVLLCLSISACAWVKLTPGGEKVRVLGAAEVTTCKDLGTTTVSLLAKVAGINRNEDEVSKELSFLARNAAADLGGDTIVPISAVKEGKRSYAVYQCIGVSVK